MKSLVLLLLLLFSLLPGRAFCSANAGDRAALQAEITALRAEAADLAAEEKRLQASFTVQERDVLLLMDALRAAAEDGRRILRQAPRAEDDAVLKSMRPFLTDSYEPASMEQIAAFADAWSAEVRASGQVEVIQARIAGPDGTVRTGSVLRIGRHTSYSLGPKGPTAVLCQAESSVCRAVQGYPAQERATLLQDFIQEKGLALPIDPTDGEMLQQEPPATGLRARLLQGGPVVWPLLLVALAGMVLILERGIFLGRIRLKQPARFSQVFETTRRGEIQTARTEAASLPDSPTAAILRACLDAPVQDREALENRVHEVLIRETTALERFLPTLNLLGVIAPLLGLLGTVTGMITTFDVITLFGADDTRLLSGGISEALVTTQLGLAVAVPLLLAHHLLERRVDAVTAHMEEIGAACMAALQKRTEDPQREP